MRGPSGFEVRSYDSGAVGRETIKRRQDALRAAQTAASRGERFVFVYHQSGLCAVEMLPYCPASRAPIPPDLTRCVAALLPPPHTLTKSGRPGMSVVSFRVGLVGRCCERLSLSGWRPARAPVPRPKILRVVQRLTGSCCRDVPDH